MYFVDHYGADLLNEALALRVSNKAGVEADHLQKLLAASVHRQIIIVKSEKDEPLASIAFAKISKYTLRLLAAIHTHALKPYEYREGKILYVVDGFFGNNNFKKSLALLLQQLKKYRLIAHVKNGRLRIYYNSDGTLTAVKLG